MSVSTIRMTAEQFLQLGEDPVGVRLELVNGEVAVSPSPVPDHSRVVVRMTYLLERHNQQNDLGELYQDVDTILDRFTVRRPDLLFFFKQRTHLVGKKAMEGPPDLAIEIISPSSVDTDRVDKFAEYRDAGIAHYWIINPEDRTIEGWRLDAGQYLPAGRGQGTAVVNLPPFPDLDISLGELWRR
jgi:Uma2 family endonuclease